MSKSKIFWLILFCCIGQSSYINAQPKLVSGISINVENDTFLHFLGLGGLNKDRNYTQGLDVSFNSPLIAAKLFKKYNPDSQGEILPAKITLLKVSAFTPDDLQQTTPIDGERPYSSVVWFGIKNALIDTQNYKSKSWDYQAGIIGLPNIAGDIQTAIHKPQNRNNTQPPYNPMGWHNQISNGGEPTFLFTYNSMKLLNTSPLKDPDTINNTSFLNAQFILLNTVDIGHITMWSQGISMRFGKLDLNNWYYTSAWNIDSQAQLIPKAKTAEIYIFTDVKAGIMVYNGSLHGQFRYSEYRVPYKETGFISFRGRTGLAFNKGRFASSIYIGVKSPEIWNEFSRSHYWAGFSFNFPFCNN